MQATDRKQIAYWLFSGCFLIFCMVVIGGITRLTGSGLSITEWQPIMGAIPPLNEEDWNIAFEKYKLIPQYERINYHFTLSEFKSIFWWEYIHRLVGRLIGLVFIIPFFWFLLKKKIDSKTIRRSLFLFLLGLLQGFIGWFMVKSGLTERTSVSHIRLAIHLIAAFATFGFTLYYALDILSKTEIKSFPKIRRLNKILFSIIILQIIYGAFVAGLHAGTFYNTFPLMNGMIFPPGLFAIESIFLNFINNAVTVQFIHRILAFLILILSIILWYRSKKYELNNHQKSGINFLALAVLIQFTLGIITLLTSVNIVLASLHQIGAFLLFSSGVYLAFYFRRQ